MRRIVWISECNVRKCGPRCAVLAVALFLAASFLAASISAAGETSSDKPRGAESGDLVRCPDCDSHGKVACPVCGGRGEIYKPCDICKGAGRKPCPVCNKPEARDNGVEPGRLPCPRCKGKGTVGNNAKTCSRCGGVGSILCETCLGRGTVPCRKEVFVKVCPRCRAVGKTTCPTCGGTRLVAPSVLAARRAAAKIRGPRSNTDPHGMETRPRVPEGSRSKAGPRRAIRAAGDAGEEIPSSTDIEARYRGVVPICEAHFDVFVEDKTPAAETIRKQLMDLATKLREVDSDAARDMLEDATKLIQRAASFRRRWHELKELFDKEHRSYSSLQKNWARRAEALQEAPSRRLEEEEREWNRRLDILLNVCEKTSGKLGEDDPSWLLKEIEDLEKTWNALEKRGLDAVSAAQVARSEKKKQEAIEKEKAAAARRVSAAKSARRTPRRSPPPRSGTGGTPRARRDARNTDRSREAGTLAGASSRDSKASGRAASAASTIPTASSDVEDTARPSGSSALLWALLGFGAACGLFFGLSRWKSRRDTRALVASQRREDVW